MKRDVRNRLVEALHIAVVALSLALFVWGLGLLAAGWWLPDANGSGRWTIGCAMVTWIAGELIGRVRGVNRYPNRW